MQKTMGSDQRAHFLQDSYKAMEERELMKVDLNYRLLCSRNWELIEQGIYKKIKRRRNRSMAIKFSNGSQWCLAIRIMILWIVTSRSLVHKTYLI